MSLNDKIREAEKVLKLAAEMSLLYYKEPLIITYSGGKDSDVMLDIALECLKADEFEVVHEVEKKNAGRAASIRVTKRKGGENG